MGWLKHEAEFSIPKQPSIPTSPRETEARITPRCSASPPPDPCFLHPYLAGVPARGLECLWAAGLAKLEAQAALQRLCEGMLAPTLPWHSGVPACSHPLPAG